MSDARRQFRRLFLCSLLFFLVYVGIHFWLNYTAQGMGSAAALAPTPDRPELHPNAGGAAAHDSHSYSGWAKVIIELSGPVTISICSSLLILSYGSFLIHGLRHLSISLPTAFFTAFLIFIGGQIAVQIVGHWEIWVTNYNIAFPLHPLPPWVSWPSAFSYAIAFSALYFLENYAFRVFARLSRQIPKSEIRHGHDAHIMARLTVFSIVLILLKLLIVEIDSGAKFGMVLATLFVEFGIAIYVVAHLWKRSAKEAAS